MPLSMPKYIRASNAAQAPLSYRWDDYDPYAILPDVDEEVMGRLEGVSNRAAAAFAIGCAEWVAFRLQSFEPDTEAIEALEARWLWAMNADPGIAVLIDPTDWTGPVRGPDCVAVLSVENAINLSEEGTGANHAAIAASVALYVLPDPYPFLQWQEAVLTRLEALYPMNEENRDGRGVPREALDPDANVTPDNEAVLIQAFVKSRDRRANRYLALFDQGYE